MDNILAVILNTTYSLTQLKHRLRVLKANLLKTFFGGSFDEKLTAEDLNFLKSLPTNFYQQFNKNNVYNIFAAIEEQTSRHPTLTLCLAFDPDETTLTQIGQYARKTFNLSTLLLDLKLDPNLIAGAALVWKGVYKDYSLRADIESRKVEISQGFKKFLR